MKGLGWWRYDFSIRFGDQKVILAGIGSLMDLRQAVKNLKKLHPDKAKTITLRNFEISPHTFCNDCLTCPNCKKQLHSCEGHPHAHGSSRHPDLRPRD